MKRKIQHNAVNNQEDEDSCTSPICFQGDAPIEKKEDIADEESRGQLFSDAPGAGSGGSLGGSAPVRAAGQH